MTNPALAEQHHGTANWFDVGQQRASLVAAISRLPTSSAQSARKHYRSRVRRSQGRPVFGELVVPMLADLLGVRRPSRHVQLAWMLLYDHCLMIDDLCDTPRDSHHGDGSTAAALLEMALAEFQTIIDDRDSLWVKFDDTYARWRAAMHQEREWSRTAQLPSADEAVAIQGEKSAVVTFCAEFLVLLGRHRPLSSDELVQISRLCSAVQLLDDVADLSEDLREGRSNVLLWRVRDLLIGSGGAAAGKQPSSSALQIYSALTESGALSWSWSKAAENIEGALLGLDQYSPTARMLSNLASNCRRSSEVLDEAAITIRCARTSDNSNRANAQRLLSIAQIVNRGPRASQ